jgi:hypothetical protein
MSKLLKEISVITGSYTNAEGMKKNRYTRIGSIIDTSNGPMLKLDTIPLKEGGWDGWGYLNDPKPKDDVPHPKRARGNFDNMDDHIPF